MRRENCNEWGKGIFLLLWAYREVPNDMTVLVRFKYYTVKILKQRYNHFEIELYIYCFLHNSSHKMLWNWKTSYISTKKQSYLSKLSYNGVKHIHANKIMTFNVQTASIGVIYGINDEFGDIENTTVTKQILTNEKYLNEYLNYSNLKDIQKQSIWVLLVKRSSL